ncbi:hypothetical protein PO909_024655, partial [Leuciscus waleckii]
RHGVFGQLSGQQQTHGGLDLSRCDGGALVVVSETRRFTGDALEDVVDERVHDSHRLGGDPGVGMNLLQDFVHVDRIALLPGLSALLSALAGGFSDGLLRALLGCRLRWFRHDASVRNNQSTIKLCCYRRGFIHRSMLISKGKYVLL